MYTPFGLFCMDFLGQYVYNNYDMKIFYSTSILDLFLDFKIIENLKLFFFSKIFSFVETFIIFCALKIMKKLRSDQIITFIISVE